MAAPPVTEANPGGSWAYEGLGSHCKTTHTGTAPLQQVQNVATSQLCRVPGQDRAVQEQATTAIPQHSQLKQQQRLNAESKAVYIKDSYKALSKSSIFEQMPSCLELLTHPQ